MFIGILPSQEQVLALSRYLDKYCDESEYIDKVKISSTGDFEEGSEEENIELLRLLKVFVNQSQLSNKYHLCFTKDMLRIAKLLDTLPLTLGEK